MDTPISFFSGFGLQDVLFMAEAAWRTLLISLISISLGTLLGTLFGWMLYEGRIWATLFLAPILDAFRSVPLIIQLVLFYNFVPIIGLNLDAFQSGLVVLTLYTASLVANEVRGVEVASASFAGSHRRALRRVWYGSKGQSTSSGRTTRLLSPREVVGDETVPIPF